PYISHTLTPSMCQTAMVSAGSGAPPETPNTSWSKPSLEGTGRNTRACQAEGGTGDAPPAAPAPRRGPRRRPHAPAGPKAGDLKAELLLACTSTWAASFWR